MKKEIELLAIIGESVIAFGRISEVEWAKKSNPAKWSRKQVLGHLVDSATTNLRRFVMTQYEQRQKIVYHQDEWVNLQGYQEADIREVIGLWKLLNLQIARVIGRIPDTRLQHVCDTGKDSPAYHTLEFLIEDYIGHLRHHLDQILEGTDQQRPN